MTTPTNDSVKILLPKEAIEPGFDYYSIRTGNKRASAMPGLQSIKPAIHDRSEAVLEISSKLLPGPELIHRGNIEEVFNKVNESGLITILPGAVEQAYCLSIDPATDVTIPNSQHLLEVIQLLAYHPSYRKQCHRRNHNTTFYYDRAKKGKYAGKAKVYDKFAEDQQGVYAPDTVRFELSCPTGQSIQHCYGVGANSQGRILLKSVLESTANPVAAKFEEILASLYTAKPQGGTAMEVVRSGVGINKEDVFRKGLKSCKEINIFNMLCTQHYDLESVYRIIQPTLKSRPGKGKVLAPYIAMLGSYNGFDEEVTVDYEVLMSIRELLRSPGAAVAAMAIAA